jgi:hypothetical protein
MIETTMTNPPPAHATRPPWFGKPLISMLVMWAAVVAVYVPLPLSHPGDNTQVGGDFSFLHSRRMAFAREQIAEHHRLPGWYPREMMGTPFWANVQNFPFIPTRLVLYAAPPPWAYTTGVILGALLASTFTFLYARALGLSAPASAAAGWTFACAGFYASRVLVGALPLLEAYPALPLLLWLIEVNLRDAVSRRQRVLALAGIALASLCVALAGHPQLPFYAFVTAGLYLLVRGWGAWGRVFTAATAMGLGVACAAFALLPMVLLIGRSTRSLTLDHEVNNIAMPYARIAAIVLPWKDGKPAETMAAPGAAHFPQFPDDAYVFDTVTYVGLLPLAAALLLAARAAVRRERPGRVALFLAAAGIVAFVTALPPFHGTTGETSATFLRSPVRQTYVTTFALAMALGAFVDVAGNAVAAWASRRALAAVAIGVLLAAHAVDLAVHDRVFVCTIFMPTRERSTAIEAELRRAVGDGGRVAIDYQLAAPFNRRIDDVGGFDSIILARPYATLLALNRTRATYNTQMISGSQLRGRTLASAGVKLVMTNVPRRDLPRVGAAGDVPLYAVPDPVPRAMFLPRESIVFVPPNEMRPRMRDGRFDPHTQLMLPPEAQPAPATRPAATGETRAEYERPESDEIVVTVKGKPAGGYVRVLESFDPGWRAEVNGKPAEVLAADDTFLSVAVPAGDSTVRFTYHTPGAMSGMITSLVSVALLGVFLLVAPRVIRTTERP